MKKPSCHPVKSRGVLGALLLLLATPWLGVGCSEPKPTEPPPVSEQAQTAEARFSINFAEDTGQSLPGGGGVSAHSTRRAQAIRAQDVTRILVDVWEEGKQDTPLFVNFELDKAPDALEWSGAIPFLPRNKPLTFFARAYEADNPTAIFSGSTNQTLTGDRQTVIIRLAPSTNGAPISLPRITRISIPSEFISGQAGNISFSVEATADEQLTYTITRSAEASSGTFFPASGSITLLARAGTFVSQYIPDTVTAVTSFSHTVKVTNRAGHSVSTTFTTRVRPPDATDGVADTNVRILFNPVIAGLDGRRIESTHNVIFTATISDDGPAEALTYAWSFEPNGTYDPAPTFTGNTNPTLLQNYTPAVQGTLRLAVTDGNNGTTTLSYLLTPGQFPDNAVVDGPLTGINSIRGGEAHTCALFNNGTLRCWGLNSSGQLGYENTLNIGDDELPYTVGDVKLVGKGVRLAVGGRHTCALMEGGLVRCWGENQYGQLGYNSTLDVGDGEPVASFGYVNLAGNVVKLAAGHEHSCALMEGGTVRCWGRNQYGQLGYGNTHTIGDNEQPWRAGGVDLGGLPAKDIVAGAYHSCALLTTGQVRCWGYNQYGQLGFAHYNTIGDNEHPASEPLIDVGGPVRQLSSGGYHTCALLETGFVRCWGANIFGQTGFGSGGTFRNCPEYNASSCYVRPLAQTGTVNVGTQVLQVAAGINHTCALLSTGGIKCWGTSAQGQLGYGNTTVQYTPISATVDLDGATAYQVSVGHYHSCALLSTGKARCWGQGTFGRLGYGNTTTIGDNEQPSAAGDLQLLTPAP